MNWLIKGIIIILMSILWAASGYGLFDAGILAAIIIWLSVGGNYIGNSRSIHDKKGFR